MSECRELEVENKNRGTGSPRASSWGLSWAQESKVPGAAEPSWEPRALGVKCFGACAVTSQRREATTGTGSLALQFALLNPTGD